MSALGLLTAVDVAPQATDAAPEAAPPPPPPRDPFPRWLFAAGALGVGMWLAFRQLSRDRGPVVLADVGPIRRERKRKKGSASFGALGAAAPILCSLAVAGAGAAAGAWWLRTRARPTVAPPPPPLDGFTDAASVGHIDVEEI